MRRICERFPNDYWVKLDHARRLPDRVRRGADRGRLPRRADPGGVRRRRAAAAAACAILETIHDVRLQCRPPATPRCTSWARCCGTAARRRSSSYLPGIASGELRLQAFGVTEPTTGSDTTQLKTRAEKKGNDHYVVNGQKVWTSRALHSDLMLLLARTTPADKVKKRSDGLSVFLVDLREARGKGVEIRPIKAMINHNTTEVFFDNLEVPAENLIGEEGKGFRYILDGMNAERILIASESLGDARWFIRTATDYAKERVVFGRPIGQNQGVQFPIARAHAETRGRRADGAQGRGPVRGRARLRRGGQHGQAAGRRGGLARGRGLPADAIGGFGFAREYDIERKWRETRLYQTAPISTNMVLAYVAQHVLGLPRSY